MQHDVELPYSSLLNSLRAHSRFTSSYTQWRPHHVPITAQRQTVDSKTDDVCVVVVAATM